MTKVKRYADEVALMDADAIIRELVAATENWILDHDSDAGDVKRALESRIVQLGIARLRHAPDCRAELEGDCGSASCHWEAGHVALMRDLEERITRLEKDHVDPIADGADVGSLPYKSCGFLFDYDDDTRTHHLFVSSDDRSVTLDVRHVVDMGRRVQADEASICCSIHMPSLRRFPSGQHSEDVYDHVISDPDKEDLLDALKWLVGQSEMPAKALAVASATKQKESL